MVQGVQKWFFLPDQLRVSKWIENCCTRITPSSSTLIDIYTTLPLDKVTPGILINDLSDHLPIFVSIKSSHVEKVNTKAQFKHDFSNLNAQQFMEEIKETPNSMIISIQTTQQQPWMMQLLQLKKSLMIMHH